MGTGGGSEEGYRGGGPGWVREWGYITLSKFYLLNDAHIQSVIDLTLAALRLL